MERETRHSTAATLLRGMFAQLTQNQPGLLKGVIVATTETDCIIAPTAGKIESALESYSAYHDVDETRYDLSTRK